jgi:hypothetical protein
MRSSAGISSNSNHDPIASEPVTAAGFGGFCRSFFGCLSHAACYILVTKIRESPNAVMPTDLSNGDNLMIKSSLYKEFQAELDEILRHKWLESEKAGCDIGFELALTDWIVKHRSKWRKSRQNPSRPDFENKRESEK